MRRVFFHIHLWKTGGGTFLNICRNNFKRSFHRDIMLIQNWVLAHDQISWLLQYHPWIRCYSCHMISSNLPYDETGVEVIGVSFVRNPVDRFISSYNYQKADNYKGGFAKDSDFDVFCDEALEYEDNPFWRDGQSYILSGEKRENQLAIIKQLVKSGRLLLLVNERFDESCILLEKLFPDDFHDCSYIRRNITQHKELVTESQRSKISEFMTSDFELVGLSNEMLDKNLSRFFENNHEKEKALDDFKYRCCVKEKREKYLRKAKNIESAIKRTLKYFRRD